MYNERPYPILNPNPNSPLGFGESLIKYMLTNDLGVEILFNLVRNNYNLISNTDIQVS